MRSDAFRLAGLVAAGLAALALTGCETLGDTAGEIGRGVGEVLGNPEASLPGGGVTGDGAPPEVPTTPREEWELGRQVANRLLDRHRPTGPAAANDYLSLVGAALAQHSARATWQGYRFQIVEGDAPLAFAVPGGYVMISKGSIAQTRSEAELAGVLAHEIAHVEALHPLQRRPGETATDTMVSRVAKLPFSDAMLAAADRRATEMMVATGYPEAAYGHIMVRLGGSGAYAAQHPVPAERRQRLERLASGEAPSQPVRAARHRQLRQQLGL